MTPIRNKLLKTSTDHLLKSQKALLEHFVDYPFIHSQVELPSGHIINYVDSKQGCEPSNPNERTLVVAHGLGSGLGFFFMNIDNLLKDAGKGGKYDRVIAFDWLGFGASSRPDCRAPRHQWWSSLCSFSLCKSRFCQSDNENSNPNPSNPIVDSNNSLHDTAAAFFVDSFEEFRAAKQIERFTLVGHSLGGYLSARYAIRYPQRLDGMVLASPVGVPIPSDTDYIDGIATFDIPWSFRLIDAAWSANVTPGQLFRAWSFVTQNGQANIESIVRRRFNNRWNTEETCLVADYLYHLTVQPGSGEFAMNSLLVPRLADSPGHPERRGKMYARVPFTPYLHLFPKTVPILVLFGDHDWLAPQPNDAEILMNGARRAGLDLRLEITPSAGHHLYMDNHSHFNNAINELHK